jgi:site-specific DNA recombinase
VGEVIPLTPRPSAEPVASRRALIYLRVSTAEQAATDYDQDGYSLQAQRDACRRAADNLGAEVVDEYVDRGKSARTADRPALQSMLRRLAAEQDVDYVIVHKVDRLARSRADDVQIVLAMRKAGATLVSATENIDETPSGTLLHAIMAAVAEFYSGNLAQEARKGMRKKAELGGTPGNAPVGYLNTRDRIDGRDVGIVVPDTERAQHVSWAFRAYATGDYTLSQLTDELNDRGFTLRATARYPERPVTISLVHRMLHNRYYLGIVTFGGVESAGRHEALVDEVTFQHVQDLLTSRSLASDKPRQHPHPLKGPLHCGRCGRRLGIVHAKGHGGVYPYFYCLGRQKDSSGCPQMFVRVERIEAAVLRHLDTFRLDDVRREELRRVVMARFGDQVAGAQREVASQQGRIVKLNRRREKAKDAYFADAMDIAEFKEEQRKITTELAAAELIIQRNLATAEDLSRGLDEGLSLLVHPAGFYQAAPDSIKQMLVQAIFEKLWIVDDEVAGSDLTDTYAGLLGVEAIADARLALAGGGDNFLSYERREPVSHGATDVRTYLRIERPRGRLGVDRPCRQTGNKALGSNIDQLVGLTGFEPAASSSRTTRATKLRHSPKRSESTQP